MPLDKSMFETNAPAIMGMGDFEARQRAMKQQDRRRKSDCTEMLRQTKFGGLNENDMKLAEIKKEGRLKAKEATDFNHVNLSKNSQDMNGQYLKDKAMKEEDRSKKQAADEQRRSYKGGVKEEDVKLAAIKKELREKEKEAHNFNNVNLSKNSQDMNGQYLKDKAIKEEERTKKQAADEQRRSYKGGVKEEDLKLMAIKKEDRSKKQAADENNRGYKGGVREDDLKLMAIKKEDRMKKQAADEHNHTRGTGVKPAAESAPVADSAPPAKEAPPVETE